MSELNLITLKESDVEIIDGDRGKNYPKTEDFKKKGYCLFLSTKNVREDGFDFSDCQFISKQKDESLRKGKLRRNDIVLTTRGTLGNIGFFTKSIPFGEIRINSGMVILRCQKNVLPEFLYLFLKSNLFKYQVQSFSSGSAQPQLPIRDLQEILIPLLNLEEQKAIAAVLSCLDVKIENLRKQNETLEAIAQTLFKHWFIDFEFPNQDGKPYKSSGGAMIPSELGEIPEGWRVESLDSIADFLNGLALQKYPPENENDILPVIKIRELKQRITDNTDKATKNIPEQYVIDNGDIIFSWSGSLEVAIWCLGKGALNQHLFKVTSEKFPKWFYHQWVLSHLKIFQHIAKSKATTMGHIQRKHLTEALCVVPTDNQLKDFNNVFSPLLDKSIKNALEIQTLTKTRDTLLPKLMSGQLRVN
ncbi:hypothetical protein AWQ21_14625 (plasmid) [Picosynechococcus sp. PCC 7003]|uniref:restriction endonuclease subunit S n=1 Tax=Picosynechococcus sp. PCC 7003 TaxID=374981 RepID=UPI000810CB2A|nr:restriction endonuclease subunit S [Picosynechococcus sp. PCC 7003]ANV85766.1 hypothetical protein AWQ21_14625 [Picosynechococcus sp. PCC 7003]